MKKKALYISRQLLIGIVALQLLNLSVGSEACGEDDYDYSYSYNKTYDPTETAVEWIVEMTYGQQPAFSYDNHNDTNKNISRIFHWQTDLHECRLIRIDRSVEKSHGSEPPAEAIPSPSEEIISPPPEALA